MKFHYRHRDTQHSLDILPSAEGFQAQIGEQSHALRVIKADEGSLLFEVDGRPHRVHWAKVGRRIWLHLDGRTYSLERSAAVSAASAAVGSGESILRAPMPGQLRELLVAEGDQVESGQLLMLLEAMKMEIRIQAPRAGVIAQIAVQAGDSVEKDQILVELEGDQNQKDN